MNDQGLPPDGPSGYYTLYSMDDSKSKDIQYYIAQEITACMKRYWIKHVSFTPDHTILEGLHSMCCIKIKSGLLIVEKYVHIQFLHNKTGKST